CALLRLASLLRRASSAFLYSAPVSAASRLGTARRCPAVMAVMQNAASETQFLGSVIVNVYRGLKKKKLKQSAPSSAANSAGRLPQSVATKSTASKNAIATVV